MKKQPAKKRATKKPRKRSALLHGNPIGDAIAKAARHGEEENFLAAMKRRCDAAEQKAARLEEENVKFAKELIRWQDTVKLRNEAIGRKEQRIKELMEQLQRADSQVVDQAKSLQDLRDQIGMDFFEGQFVPPGTTYRKVLEAEVEARKKALDENARLLGKLQEATDQNIELLNQVDRLSRKDPGYEKTIEHLRNDRDRLREELQSLTDRYCEMKAARVHWENRADVLAEELARYKKPPQPVPEPHRVVTEWTMTFADLAEFVRLFKAVDGA